MCVTSNSAFAKAYFAGKKEMIEKAECIAIVNIDKIEKVQKKGQHWTYHQKASGTIEKTLKGDASGIIEIFGMEDFITFVYSYLGVWYFQ